MDRTRRVIREWLVKVLAETALSPSALASKAGLSHTTITRFMNNVDAPILELASIAAISEATGIGAPRDLTGAADMRREVEVTPLEDPEAVALVSTLAPDYPHIHAWTVHTRNLELSGLLPGDTILVDMEAEPRRGDVVMVQHYVMDTQTARTVLRRYEPPCLISHSTTKTDCILDVNGHVAIKGVMHSLVRRRNPVSA